MAKRISLMGLLVVLSLLAVVPAFAAELDRPNVGGPIYVTSQDKYYDVKALGDLPLEGPFQKLENGTTEFGPGDPGYLGGRWWVDVNGDDQMDAGDRYFLCPLLGPGRDEP